MRKKTRIARALDCTLTPEQYARRTHDTPYLYTLGTGEEALTFVGARHSTDPDDMLFTTIDQQFSNQQFDLVVVEGMQDIQATAGTERFIAGLHREEAILRGGESVFTVKQALDRGIPWMSPERPDAALLHHLLMDLYAPQTIINWYVLRILGQYHRRSETMPFSAYVAPFLTYIQRETAWPHVTYRYDEIIAKAGTLLGTPINIYNHERAEEYTNPIPYPHRWEQQTIFNDITRSALKYRDRWIIKAVAREVLAGKRVLVVYGAGHAVMQEPAYRFLLER